MASMGTNASEIATAQVESKASRVDVWERRIDRYAADRDAAVGEARKSIEAIHDEVDGMSAADNHSVQKLQDDITKYNEDYDSKVGRAEVAIDAILGEKEVATVEQVAAENIATTWAVFNWLGRRTPVSTYFCANWGRF